MAGKAAQARRDYREARRAELAQLRADNAHLTAELAASLAGHPARSSEGYAETRLSHVREQLDRVTSLLAKSTDALEVERYARALAALSSQEFALAGRPLPGSLRPTAAAARKSADYRGTLTAPSTPPAVAPASNPFRRAGQ
jgi:hypothetical protein